MVLEHGGKCKRGGKCTKVQSCDVLIEGLCDCTYTRTEYSSMTYVPRTDLNLRFFFLPECLPVLVS